MEPKGTLLLVEDNPDDVDLTLLAFEQAKIRPRVVVVRDGAEALDYFFATGAHADRDVRDLPVVTLLDLNLPKIGGLEVLRRIRADERTRSAPVVILTSSDEERDRLEGYQHLVNSYVRKPVRFDEFVTVARQLGVYWMVLNLPPPERT